MTETIEIVEHEIARGRALVENRTAVVADVRFSERIIELVAVPYNEDTVVEHRNRWITESVLPGAFEGIDTRPVDKHPVTVNRDHDYKRTIGKAVRFRPSAAEGLVSELFISETNEGEEALRLASDGVLRASVGMAVRSDKDQRWSDGGRRRQIVRAFLDHIALVANPAYAGASVLAVRAAGEPAGAAPVATPRLDAVLRWMDSDKSG